MKKAVAVLLAVVALACAAAASANAASDPRVPGLQRQVTRLQQQMRTLVTVIVHDEDLATCRAVYQSHFNYGVLNIFNLMLGSPQIADQTGSDNGACSRVGISPPARRLAGVMPLQALYPLALPPGL
jgi:hypothetical protein